MAITIQRLQAAVQVGVHKGTVTVGPDAVSDFMPGHTAERTVELWSVRVDKVAAGVVYHRSGRWYAAARRGDALVELPLNLGTRDFAIAALRNSLNK
jgi:hypothetical protein